MYTLAIDPGNCTGWALASGDTILNAGVCDPSDINDRPVCWKKGPITWRMIIEMPQITPTTPNPASILKLCVSLGRMVEWFQRERPQSGPVSYVYPVTWKGNVPKDVHHARIVAALCPGEREKVKTCGAFIPHAKRHNMLDAVGLCLYAVGRRVR